MLLGLLTFPAAVSESTLHNFSICGLRLLQQDEWARRQSQNNLTDLWALVGLLLAQQDGLHDGYNARVASQEHSAGGLALTPLDKADFLLLSAVGELHWQHTFTT